MSAVPKLITLEQYLVQEREAAFKSEFLRGEVFAMAGCSPNHSLIAANFVGACWQLLRGKPCKVFNSDLRVKVSASGLYTYPDASVVCGELQFDDARKDTLINPTVLVEVLSESTEKYDRGAKSGHYRQITLLQEIVLISPDEPLVERLTRQANGGWLLMESRELSDEVHLESLGISFSLSDVYRGLAFESKVSAHL